MAKKKKVIPHPDMSGFGYDGDGNLMMDVDYGKKVAVQQTEFPRVDDWSQLNVYLKKSDIRYIRFEYPPFEYSNDNLKTNTLIAGDTKFTGTNKNRPYKIMELFIKSDRIERYPDEKKDYGIEKTVSKLNQFFTSTFHNNVNPIISDKDLIYGYTTKIKFQYQK